VFFNSESQALTMSNKRQGSMSTKVYKLDIKHDTKKSTIHIPMEHSIYQLKEIIQSQFNVKPEEQTLFCNGKLVGDSDYMTLKQAKITNGSKITCNKIASSVGNPSTQAKSVIVIEVDETLKKLENIVKNASVVIKSVHNLEKERRRLQNDEYPPTQGGSTADFKRLKFECGKNGEQLIRLLETLDQMTFSEGQTEHRAKRKQVATKLNYVLDQNDKIIEKLTSAIKDGC
jgi:hypothetical protein